MPSYTELMLQEVQQQRSEQACQHDELLTAVSRLTTAVQRLEAGLARLQAQGVMQGSSQVQPQAQVPPPAENLHRLGRVGALVRKLIGSCKKCLTCYAI